MRFFKHKKRIVLCLAAVVAAVSFLIGYIDVNSRFPKPREELYHIDEWIRYDDNIRIRAKGIDYCNFREIADRYGIKAGSSEKTFYLVARLEVDNKSEENINIRKIVENLSLIIYPSGYINQGVLGTDIPYIDAGEAKETIIYFTVGEVLLRSSRREAALRKDLYLCFSSYPVKKAIVFEGVG